MNKFINWFYKNLVHLFGVLGVVLSVLSVITTFLGSFLLTFCLLSIALGSLYLDSFVKSKV